MISSVGASPNVLAFVSKDALDEYTASSDQAAARQTFAALVGAGQVVDIPNGTSVVVVDWSGWSGWHKVRIASGPHIGHVVYLLDQWTTFK